MSLRRTETSSFSDPFRARRQRVDDAILRGQLRSQVLQPHQRARRRDDLLVPAAGLFRAVAEHAIQVHVLLEQIRGVCAATVGRSAEFATEKTCSAAPLFRS